MSRASLQQTRLHYIEQQLEAQGSITVTALAEQLNVAQMTIRRDLDVVCQSPVFQRVHGGAVRTLPAATGNTPYHQRLHTNQEEKTAIARHISSLVNPGETLYLGAGTTTWYVAEALADIPRLTVVTNSLQIAALLGDHSRQTVIVVGGILNREEFSLVGNFARQDVRSLRLDKAIMSIRGIHPIHGLTSELTPDSDQSFMENSSNIIIAADHTKFGAVAANQLAPLGPTHHIVTSTRAHQEMFTSLRALGVKITQVETGDSP